MWNTGEQWSLHDRGYPHMFELSCAFLYWYDTITIICRTGDLEFEAAQTVP